MYLQAGEPWCPRERQERDSQRKRASAYIEHRTDFRVDVFRELIIKTVEGLLVTECMYVPCA